MKKLTLIFISAFLLLSCKSHKDVSRNVVSERKVETYAITNDSSKTHRETLLDSEETIKEETNTFTRITEFGPDNNVASITETWNNINLQVDFKSRLNEIKREELTYRGATQIIDTTSQVINEVMKETKDSRPVQGVEWMWVMIAAIVIITVMRLITIKWSPY